MKELEILLLDQHYPERIIKASIEKALKAPQSELKNVKEHQKKKILSFILTFNPSNHKILPIITIPTQSFSWQNYFCVIMKGSGFFKQKAGPAKG